MTKPRRGRAARPGRRGRGPWRLYVDDQLDQTRHTSEGALLFDFCLVRFEINVDLLADNEWSGIPQIYNDLHHIDIVELTRIAGIDPAGADDAGDGRNLSAKITAAERSSANHHTLPDPYFSQIL